MIITRTYIDDLDSVQHEYNDYTYVSILITRIFRFCIRIALP